MRILAMDTSARACSAAVWDEGQVTQRLVELDHGHSELLIPLVLETMAAAGRRFNELDLVTVTVGPGAFTGLRVGLAAARGMALAARLPCMGMTTLEAMASAVDPREATGRLLLVTLDTKRSAVYAQVFRAGEPVTPPMVVDPPDLAEKIGRRPVLLAGDAAGDVIPALREAGVDASVSAMPGYPTAASAAGLAARRWQAGMRTETMPSPVYLRSPSTGLPMGQSCRRPGASQ